MSNCITLSADEMHTLHDCLTSHASSPHAELEFRFGTRDPASGAVHAGVTPSNFDFIMKLHLSHAGKFPHHETKDVSISALRQRVDIPVGADPVRYQKTRTNHQDLKEYPIRVSLAEEVPVTYDHQYTTFGAPGVNLHEAAIARKRHRHSFQLGGCRLDLTQVSEIQHYFAPRFLPLLAIGAPNAVQGALELPFESPEWDTPTCQHRYEIELEMEHPCPDLSTLMTILTQLVKYYNQSHYATKDTDITRARAELNSCFRSGCFVGGAQPRTLHRANYFDFTTAAPYAVSPKLDGARYYLFVDSQLDVYMIYPDKTPAQGQDQWTFTQVQQVPAPQSQWKQYLFDAEWVNNGLWLFDVFLQQGRVCASIFPDRQQMLSSFASLFYYLDFRVKPQFTGALETSAKQALQWCRAEQQRNRIPTDGLIFTPTSEGYPARRYASTLFKWKTTNTIDLKLNEKGRLCASIGQQAAFDIPFRPTSDLDASAQYILSPHAGDGTALVPGIVCECLWDKQHNSWTIIKLRPEKQRGNNMNVALDNFQSTINKISASVLTGDEYDPALINVSRTEAPAPSASEARPARSCKAQPRTDVYYITTEESQLLFGRPEPPSAQEQQRIPGFGGWKQNRIVAQLLVGFGQSATMRGVRWADM